jgi:predicted GNAT family acetyltransferase
LASRLVRQAIEDVRRDSITIMPLCPFAKVQIERHPEWQDVVRR